MKSRCPGQDGREIRVELYKCPKCGTEVEIFSDEVRVKCHKCGEMITARDCLPALSGAPPPASAWARKDGAS